MKTALLIVDTGAYFPILFSTAETMSESGRFRPVFHFARPYPTWSRAAARCLERGWACYDEQGRPVNAAEEDDPKRPSRGRLAGYLSALANRIYGLLIRRIDGSLLTPLVFPVEWFKLKNQLERVRKRLKLLAPDIIVLAGDLVDYTSVFYTKAGHELGIPSVIVPWLVPVGGWEQAGYFASVSARDARRVVNRLVGRMYPEWLIEYEGRPMLRLSASQVFARKLLGLAPPLPWIPHSGQADAMALESRIQMKTALANGLPKQKLVIVGSPAGDKVARIIARANSIRERLYSRLGLPEGRPMLLAAVSQANYTKLDVPGACDFTDYKKMVEFIVSGLKRAAGYNLVLLLHPSVDPAPWRYLEDEKTKICLEPTIEVIPLCQVFMASQSSVIQWAIACGKPVVNYDVYKYGYTDFVSAGGVVTVTEKDEYIEIMDRLGTDPGFVSDLKSKQEACAEEWGLFDGRSAQRLLDLFGGLIEGRRGQALKESVQ